MLIFPTNLDAGENRGRPFIKFEPEDDVPIYLPIPAGVTFTDGGSYGTIDMGAVGEMVRTGRAIIDRDGEAGISQIAEIAKNVGAGALISGVDSVAEKFIPSYRGQFLAATKMVPNRSTNVTFEGNSLRTFTFPFTLVGRTPEDSRIIRDIHNHFRLHSYPEATQDEENVMLDYPPTWDISFHNGPDTEENLWLPRIAKCYLTEVSTSFNPSALMYKVDFSPAEIQLSVTFQETRTQMRFDIEELQAGAPPGFVGPQPQPFG